MSSSIVLHKVLVLSVHADEYKKLFDKNLPSVRPIFFDKSKTVSKYIEDAEIILADPALIAPLLSQAKKLRWLQSSYAGVEKIVNSVRKPKFILTGIKGIFGSLMSEYIFAYILAMERGIFTMYENQKKKKWEKIPYKPLNQKIMGIMGVGSIGQEIAKTAKHFGMRTCGYRIGKKPASYIDEVFTEKQLSKFLCRPDYIILALPLTKKTHHIMDKTTLRMMNPTATLVNVGRGQLINESDLIQALQQKTIASAVLDVFEKEPLPPVSPLWRMNNVLVTPHNAAFSFPKKIFEIFLNNFRKFKNGEPLDYLVDFEKGY